MHVLQVVQSLPQLAGALPLDENTLSVLVMLLGIVGGFYVTHVREQMKAKKVKIERKDEPRKPR